MGLFDFLKKEKSDVEQYMESVKGNSGDYAAPEPYDWKAAERPAAGTESQMNFSGFCMTVEDVFSITGRGTVVTGHVQSGTVRVGDVVEITHAGIKSGTTVIGGIEMFRRTLDVAHEGDNVGLLLKGIEKRDVCRGDVLSKPN